MLHKMLDWINTTNVFNLIPVSFDYVRSIFYPSMYNPVMYVLIFYVNTR